MPGKDGHWIQTFTGKRVWPLSPHVDEICIEDIAHALSLQCRFTGHVREFYSVAQHSYDVSTVVWSIEHPCNTDPPKEPSSRLLLTALLHDASEAYLVDLARPIKHHRKFKFYRDAETKLEKAIARKFGLIYPYPEVIHIADNILLQTERRDLLVSIDWGRSKMNPKYRPLPTAIEPWTPADAEARFLQRFEELMK